MDPSFVLGGVGLATQLFSGAQQALLGSEQRRRANNLKLRDTTPPELLEAVARGRLDEANARLPGQGVMEAGINRQTATTADAAVRAGASASQVQAALAGADARGQSALMDLGVRSQQYRDQAKQRLTGLLGQQAQQRRSDLRDFNLEKAALLEGAERNTFNAGQSISNGVAGAASILATGGKLGKAGANGAADATATATGAAPVGPTGYGSGTYRSVLGMPDYDPFQYGRY